MITSLTGTEERLLFRSLQTRCGSRPVHTRLLCSPASDCANFSAAMPVRDDEVAFLIIHHLRALSGGPGLERATADLETALGGAGLLPVEHDFTGRARTLSYEEASARFADVPAGYLAAALAERLPVTKPATDTLFGRGALATVPAAVRGRSAERAPRSPAPRPTGQSIRALVERMLNTDMPIPISKLTYSLFPQEARRLKRLVGHTDIVYCAVYDFTSQYIVTGSDDHRLKVWNVRTGRLHRTLRGHDHVLLDIAPVPDKRVVVSASSDSTIRVWDIVTGENLHVLRDPHIKDLTVLAFSPCPDRPYLLAGDNGAEAFLWNSEDYAQGPMRIPFPVRQQRQFASSTVGTPGASTSGTRAVGDSGVAAARPEGAPPVAATSQAVQSIQPPPGAGNANANVPQPAAAPPQPVPAIAQVGPNPRQQGASNAANSVVSATPSLAVLGVAFNSGATRLALSGSDFLVHVYAVEKGATFGSMPTVRFLVSLRGHSGNISQVVFARNSDLICTASEDGTARVWRRVCTRIPRKKSATPLEGVGPWKSVVLDCKKQRQEVRSSLSLGASVTPSTSITPRVPSRSMGTKENCPVDVVMWSLLDKYIVTASSNKIRVWNSETGTVKHVLLEHSDRIYTIDAHPLVKSMILTAGYDGKCVLWDIEKGIKLRKFLVTESRMSPYFDIANVTVGDPAIIKNGKFAPDGLSFCVTDNCGAVTIFGVDSGASMKGVPEQQFFSSEFVPFNKDEQMRAVCRDTGKLLHLVEQGDLCDKQNTRHPPSVQNLPPDVPDEVEEAPEVAEILPNENEADCKRVALNSRAEQFRQSEQKEEKRLVKDAKAKQRKVAKGRRKAELEGDILPVSPLRDFVIPDSDQDIDADYEAVEEDLNDVDSGLSDDNSVRTDDEGEYSPRHRRLIRNSSPTAGPRRPMTRSMERELCTCGGKDGDSSDDDASFRMSVDNDSDVSSEPDDSMMDGPASPPARNRTNLAPPVPRRRMLIHLDGMPDGVEKNSLGGEARLSPLNRSFTSERRAKSSPDKSVDVEMQAAVEPRQTSRDSFTNKEGNDGADFKMQWSVQSGAQNNGKLANSGSKAPKPVKRRGRPPGSRQKDDSDSDFDPSEFYNREEEDVGVKDENDDKPMKPKGRRNGKRNWRKTRSHSKKANCPIHGDKAVNIDSVAASITGAIAEESDDSGSDVIRRKRRRRGPKPEKMPVNGKMGDGEEAGKIPSDPLLVSQWLRATSGRYMYVPQRGDIVYYFPQGHIQAIAHWKDRGLNPLAISTKGDAPGEGYRLDATKLKGRVEPLRFAISAISYGFPSALESGGKEDKKRTSRSVAKQDDATKSPSARTVALLTLRKEHAGASAWPRGMPQEVTLVYYPVDDIPEYMVLASRVHTSLARNWKLGDKFQMLFVNEKRVWEYYTGNVRHVSSETSAMGWSSMQVEFNEEEDPDKKVMDKLSPWELEPLNDTKNLLRPPSGNGYSAPMVDTLRDESGLFLAIAKDIDTLQMQDATFKSHMSWLHTFGTQCNSAEYCRLVPFPINLELVQTRLCTGFYRHFESFVNDIELLRSNAVLFKGKDSDEAKLAGSVYASLLNVGGRAKQKFVVTAGRDAKTVQQTGAGSHALPAVGAIIAGRTTTPYVPLAPRMPAAAAAAAKEAQDFAAVMSAAMQAPGRDIAPRNASVAGGMHPSGGMQHGVNALPPVVPNAFVPPRASSRRSAGRPSAAVRVQSSPVQRGRGGAASNPLAPGFYVPMPASGGQAGQSAAAFGIPPAMLMHPAARMMPPVQVPIAPRSVGGNNQTVGINFPVARSNAATGRNGMAAGSGSLSALLGPAPAGNGNLYAVHEAGPSSIANINGMYAGYGQVRGRVPDGGTQSCGGSMEAAGGGGGNGVRAGAGGATSESRIPGWPQSSPYSPAPSAPARSGAGGTAANSANNANTGNNNGNNASSPLGNYHHQEHSSISIAAAESTMSCGGENGRAVGESTEGGQQQ